MVKIYMLEECRIDGHHKYITVELTDEEASEWIERDYQFRLSQVSEEMKGTIKRRTCQEIQNSFDNPIRASFVKFHRHCETGLRYTDDDGDEIDIIENIADPSPSPAELYEMEYERERSQARVDAFMATLTETQKRRLLLKMEGMSERKIAEIEGCSHTSVEETFEAIKKKYNKFFG